MSLPTTTEVLDQGADGASSVALSTVLSVLSHSLGPVDWRMFELEATGKGRSDLGALMDRVEREPNGLPLSNRELTELAADLDQVINVILLIPGEGEPPTPPPIDADFYGQCRLVLECVDGGVWRVTTREPTVHEDLKLSFNNVVTGVD